MKSPLNADKEADIEISILPAKIAADETEIVERKGIGHPDTLADALAERLSVTYSNYTLKNFGVILHHNFDKLALLGGKTDVTYGYGHITSPIRVLLNGRASTSFSDLNIPAQEILENESRKFFGETFGDLLDTSKNLEFYYNIVGRSGPGRIRESKGSRGNLFEPKSIADVRGYDKLVANDTSIGCGYAPLSSFEKLILQLEEFLNSKETKGKFPWLGTDIKIMGVKSESKSSITCCVPEIAKYVFSQDVYRKNVRIVKQSIEDFAEAFGYSNLDVAANTRDDYEKNDVYLTATGSSIESGDEGIVGRGNRINGLITPNRPMNLEGACGKNPLYYVGKLYNVAAVSTANRIYSETGIPNEVFFVSQNGRNLLQPWHSILRLYDKADANYIREIVIDEIQKIPDITLRILKQEIRLY